MLGYDPRFRLHLAWPMWSYMQLEKYRNFQNNMRMVHQRQTDSEHNRPTAAELLRQSSYDTNTLVINESLTTPLPTFIRTGDSYFHEKELHLNTMLRYLGLPSLFITLSMAETKWEHLKELLRNTDNYDTFKPPIPCHMPFHQSIQIHEKKTSGKTVKFLDGVQLKTFLNVLNFKIEALHMCIPVRPKLLNPDEPYYKDAIEKYFCRPLTEEFENVKLKYSDYYQLYEIKSLNHQSSLKAGTDLDG